MLKDITELKLLIYKYNFVMIMKSFLNYFSYKIILAVVFTLIFNNKTSANTQHTSIQLDTISLSVSHLNTNKNGKLVENLNKDQFEEDVDDSLNDLLYAFLNTNTFNNKGINSNLDFKTQPFSITKVKFYILYCQIKFHS